MHDASKGKQVLARYLARRTAAPRLASECLESERGIAKLRTSICRWNTHCRAGNKSAFPFFSSFFLFRFSPKLHLCMSRSIDRSTFIHRYRDRVEAVCWKECFSFSSLDFLSARYVSCSSPACWKRKERGRESSLGNRKLWLTEVIVLNSKYVSLTRGKERFHIASLVHVLCCSHGLLNFNLSITVLRLR